MIDIHCHFLPGIDDGPATMEEAVELARIASNDGITLSILTPHIHPGRWENDRLIIGSALTAFRTALQTAGIALELGFAAEVRLTDLIFKQLEAGRIPFLGKLNTCDLLLLEFPHGHMIPGSEQLARWLIDRGICPVIAHPERNRAIMRDRDLLNPLLEAGCLLQITAGSLTGKFGSGAQQIALQLLDEDVVSFVASDAHNTKARPPILSEAYALVCERKSADVAQALFGENARAFLTGNPGTSS